ncbi:ATPase family AAA domain-containing protein [Platanthera guangdongensis]|uniref:ATPase family AAA domain-containing protein n=1 Tax=Platanthera guangdongensis TaxID=2320717 RepID=A0ABR2LKC0_9ASPA
MFESEGGGGCSKRSFLGHFSRRVGENGANTGGDSFVYPPSGSPCSRVEGCIFDHRKFLIACSDHRRFFQPHGNNHTIRIRKMKAKKLRLDLRKVANEASRKDFESEEKWLENWGEDEEFLKREGRRLHRDILRIAPIYIGGSSKSEHLYQGWDSLAGLEHVIQCMKEVVLVPLLYPEFFANLGLTPPRGVLLHGYPGTGKTHVVRALIGACSRGDKKIAYFARKGADCLGKYVGDAERQLRLLFQVAERSQPSIIFFDEIDGLAPRRSRQQDQTHSSVVSTLLSLLDGLKSRGSVIVIGATNRPDAVDPALRRPGRFDREIYFPLPSKKDRSSILSLHTRSWPNPLSGSLLSWIANTTVGYAGADLQALCAQAAIHALKRKCALQQLLSSAAKGTVQGKLPCLPSFKVEEKDWLAVLSLAPPPCSRREAGMAVNDIVASPLPAHLIPCFLLPLSLLLVSLYIDERIWLSPILFKASTSVKHILALSLEQKGLPVDSWWSHLHYLIREPFIAAKIRSMFAQCGLIISSLGSSYPLVLDQLDDESIENENFDSSGINPSTVYMHKSLRKNYPLQDGKGIGFRTLISGARRSGQRHLASCLLQGFMGHEEIRMVSLATISLEGHGDMIYGLNQILCMLISLIPPFIFIFNMLPCVMNNAVHAYFHIAFFKGPK